MRRRTIATENDTPIPTEPYIEVQPRTVWCDTNVNGYAVVMSNVGWMVE